MIYFIGDKVSFDGIENTTLSYLLNYFQDKPEIGFDIETEGFDPYTDKILSYQLGDSQNQFVVDAWKYPIELVKDLLITKLLLVHNFKFDGKFLYHNNIYPTKVWDTYLGECVLYKGDKTVRKSLESAVYRYFNYRLNKAVRGLIFRENFSARVLKYCAEDVQYLPELKQTQYNKLGKHNLLNSMNLENLFVKVLTYIEYSGIYLDTNMWKTKCIQDKKLRDDFEEQLNQWVIDNKVTKFLDNQLSLFDNIQKTTINWASPKQIVELFNHLGIDTKVTDDKTGELKDSVEAGVIEKQKDKSTIIPIYLRYKEYDKIVSTYGDEMLKKINPITNRIHTQFTQIMNTGRLSSGGRMGDKETVNLQNIPKLPEEVDRIPGKIYERECFTTSIGNILVDADYSGQEQIVFANWTLDKDLLDFYQKGLGDMHSYIASKIFSYLKDVPLKTIKTKYKDERQKAKAAGFAINYGGNGSTIANNLNIPVEEGDAIYKAYFEAFPGINNYFKKVTKEAITNGYIQFNTISNSKCFIDFFDKYKNVESKVTHKGFWEKYREEKAIDSILYRNELKPLVSKYFKLRGNISRMALNFPIQGSSAEITKLACIYIFEYIINHGLINVVKFSNVIHDEVLLECPKSIADIMAKVVEDSMNRAGNVYCKTIPLKAEVKICQFWDH